MKSIIKLLICTTLILTLLSVGVSADNSVAINEATVNDKLVNVTFNVTGLTANDDVTILVFKNDDGNAQPNESNIVYINQVSADNNSISFNLLPDVAEGRYEVRMGGTGVELVSKGYFTINSILYGDVNNDTEVDDEDAIWILRYFIGGFDLTGINIENGDINNDTEVDDEDAIWILRYFIGGFEIPDDINLPKN